MSDQSAHATTVPNPLADAGLRCPRCDYNLTGLPEPRCPECGAAFDWEQVRLAAANPPHIYFERVRGWRKVPGFFVTWATVLFAPWIFARQAVARVSAAHASVFVLVCFGGTFVSVLSGADLAFMLTWLTTAGIYILLQAVLFGILDLSGWHQPLRSLRFWLLVGCYTSAVMLTELVLGPPPLVLSDLRALLAGRTPGFMSDDMFRLLPGGVVHWAQIGLWLAGLMCCYTQRLRRNRWTLRLTMPAVLVAALTVVALYAATYEYLGVLISGWYGCGVC